MKKLLLSMLMLFVSICGFAYNCEVNGIYYDLNTEDQTASVTYKSTYDRGYSGIARIPEEVEYNGTTYSVTSIGRYAFQNCSGLTEVTISNSVTSIGDYAFEYCTGLVELTIPNSVVSIGNYVFRHCSGLTKLTIGNGVTSIGKSAFSYCSSLTELTIPNSVISFGRSVFIGCSGLEKIVVDSNNLYYDSREDCNAIISKYENVLVVGCKNTFIPTSVTSIGDDAFYYCIGLTELTIPNSVTSIGGAAFEGCTGLTELTIPNSVTSISGSAFYGCSGLTEFIIPNSVTFIGSSAFEGCTGLTELTIPNSVTSIGSLAFQHCSGLTELTIGNSVTSIGYNAFSACHGLTSITSLNTTPPNINGGQYNFSAFDITTEKNVPLHVPAGCKEAYQQAEYWKNFWNIQDDASTNIKSINADKQVKNRVYTLDGVELNTTNLSDLSTGIYIVNGKKVVVK